MKKKLLVGLVASFMFYCFVSTSHATMQYSTAQIDGYGLASHETDIFQRLGAVNGVNDGVTWSVDGGKTYGNNIALIIGQSVTFQFNFWQGNNGTHTYDQLLAVFDFNQDKDWNDAGEQLMYIPIETIGPRLHTPNDLSDSRYLNYYSTFTVSDSIVAGSSTWLRARAHCNHTTYGNVTPYGYLAQGEVEDYKITFVAAPPPVPEPATILLMCTGLVGLIGARRKKKI